MVARYRGAMVMTGRMATMGMAAEWALASLGLLIRRVGMAREWLRPPPAGHGDEGLRGRYQTQTHSHYRRWPPDYPCGRNAVHQRRVPEAMEHQWLRLVL
jgi:hypothetical protein